MNVVKIALDASFYHLEKLNRQQFWKSCLGHESIFRAERGNICKKVELRPANWRVLCEESVKNQRTA